MQIACKDIIEFTENKTFDEFVDSKAERQATSLNLLVIGETAKKILSLNIKIIDPSFLKELQQSKGLRNIVAHEYHELELESLYHTAIKYIPPFSEKLKNLHVLVLKEIEDQKNNDSKPGL